MGTHSKAAGRNCLQIRGAGLLQRAASHHALQ